MFSTSTKQSFIQGMDFLWMCNYINDKKLCEYDFKTYKRSDFYKINKQLLKSFGLFGHGMDLFFDVNSGKFNLNGLELLFSYQEENGKTYELTGYNNGLYNDIITYKDAWTDAKIMHDGKFSNQIHQYNFGFKKKLIFNDDVEFAFQVICCIPYNKPAYLEFKIVPNKDLKGQLIIKKIGKISDAIEVPLKEGYAWVGTWMIH